MLEALLPYVDQFPQRTVLVVGDVMLDRYWWGTVTRTSPEAPVPVVRKRRSSHAAGGAANVATNVLGLGGRAALVGVIGDDEPGRDLRELVTSAGAAAGLVVSGQRPTTVKTRIVAHNQHVVRVDEEKVAPLSAVEARDLLGAVEALVAGADVVVLSDYAKGVLTPPVIRAIIDAATTRHIPVLVDPKGTDYRRYNGATLLTPNKIEAALAAGSTPDEADLVHRSGSILLERLEVSAVLITQGEAGMTLFERGQPPQELPVRARVVYDVTGAGDTVMAALSLAIATGADLIAAGQLANLAGGLAVEQVSTTVVTADQVRLAIKGL